MKIKDGCRQPYLLTDQNHFRMETSRPLVELLRKVFKNSDNGLGDVITRKCLRKDGRMDARWPTVR